MYLPVPLGKMKVDLNTGRALKKCKANGYSSLDVDRETSEIPSVNGIWEVWQVFRQKLGTGSHWTAAEGKELCREGVAQ